MIRKNIDEITIILFIIIVSPLLIHFDSFDLIYQYTRLYEKYELDELFTIIISTLIALSIYSIKKFKDLEKMEKENIKILEIDYLTKLKNRNAFLKYDENEFKYIVLLNVIDFSVFNNYLGFKKADELLIKIANELQNIIQEDINQPLFRIYGDEFAFYCNEVDIEKLLKRVKLLFEKRFLF